MNQLRRESFGEKFFETLKTRSPGSVDVRLPEVTPTPQDGTNPLQKALNDYQRMETELDRVRESNRDLSAANMALVAEVSMLREELERADSDRIRLQAVSSTLLGRLLAINDCIAGAVRASIKDGIEAVAQAKPDPDLEGAAQEVQTILQRAAPTPVITAAPGSPGAPRPPEVDWSPIPQG